MRKTLTASSLAVALVGALMLAGCSSEPEVALTPRPISAVAVSVPIAYTPPRFCSPLNNFGFFMSKIESVVMDVMSDPGAKRDIVYETNLRLQSKKWRQLTLKAMRDSGLSYSAELASEFAFVAKGHLPGDFPSSWQARRDSMKEYLIKVCPNNDGRYIVG